LPRDDFYYDLFYEPSFKIDIIDIVDEGVQGVDFYFCLFFELGQTFVEMGSTFFKLLLVNEMYSFAVD